MFLELGDPLAAEAVGLAGVNDAGDGVDGDFVDKELELDDVAFAPLGFFVVEAGVALCDALELAEEVVDEVGEREVVFQDDLGGGEEL